MKFRVTKTSDWDYKETKEISSLEELMEFVKKNGSIIISTGISTGDMPNMEIYDDWREWIGIIMKGWIVIPSFFCAKTEKSNF